MLASLGRGAWRRRRRRRSGAGCAGGGGAGEEGRGGGAGRAGSETWPRAGADARDGERQRRVGRALQVRVGGGGAPRPAHRAGRRPAPRRGRRQGPRRRRRRRRRRRLPGIHRGDGVGARARRGGRVGRAARGRALPQGGAERQPRARGAGRGHARLPQGGGLLRAARAPGAAPAQQGAGALGGALRARQPALARLRGPRRAGLPDAGAAQHAGLRALRGGAGGPGAAARDVAGGGGGRPARAPPLALAPGRALPRRRRGGHVHRRLPQHPLQLHRLRRPTHQDARGAHAQVQRLAQVHGHHAARRPPAANRAEARQALRQVPERALPRRRLDQQHHVQVLVVGPGGGGAPGGLPADALRAAGAGRGDAAADVHAARLPRGPRARAARHLLRGAGAGAGGRGLRRAPAAAPRRVRGLQRHRRGVRAHRHGLLLPGRPAAGGHHGARDGVGGRAGALHAGGALPLRARRVGARRRLQGPRGRDHRGARGQPAAGRGPPLRLTQRFPGRRGCPTESSVDRYGVHQLPMIKSKTTGALEIVDIFLFREARWGFI